MKEKTVVYALFLVILICGCVNKKTAENEKVAESENNTENNTTSSENNDPGYFPITELKSTRNERPAEFAELSRSTHYGNLSPIPVEDFTLEDLQSCSWHRDFSNLLFSKEGNYARMGIDGLYFGKYILSGNKITFYPPIELVRFAENYTLTELYYSNEMYFEGSPVLTNDEESVIFTPRDAIYPKEGDIVKIQNHYCERIIDRKAKVNVNGILYALPDVSSKNMFEDDYYGERATEARSGRVAKTTVNDTVWYYTRFNFTSGEPIDGGGPYYSGWLPQECFTEYDEP